MDDILLIDDDIEFTKLFKVLCAKNGIKKKVHVAKNPIEALDLFKKNQKKIQVVICDFYLPIQNGTDILEIFKLNHPYVNCCLISANESIIDKKFPNIDHYFVKNDITKCIDYLAKMDWLII